ncbi:ABC-type transport system involved in cytochrome bd biosynthesis fused ATPase/permease subunit [Bradyrhizobium sp. LM2.7]
MPEAETATAEAPAKAAAGGNILQVRNLEAWYGESHILHGINFDVNAGEVVTLLGRNGAGKTTTLKSIMGIIGKRTGSVKFNNEDIIRTTSDKIARMGIAFCPEERGIFSSLDVRENLLLPPVVRAGGLPLEQIFDLFPNLKERLNSQGTKLSGGEQQMLAIARILRTGARLPDAGRADRGPRARHHPADRPHHCAAQEGRLHDPSGRAEFPVRVHRGRPLLRGRARQDHRWVCQR